MQRARRSSQQEPPEIPSLPGAIRRGVLGTSPSSSALPPRAVSTDVKLKQDSGQLLKVYPELFSPFILLK